MCIVVLLGFLKGLWYIGGKVNVLGDKVINIYL